MNPNSCLKSPVALLLALLASAAHAQGGAPGTAGRAKDQVAFAAARATVEPGDRIVALRGFLDAFPDSSLTPRTATLLLETYLQAFPERTAEIHALATAQVRAAPPGFERWFAQAQIADMLASAGTAGADLADAKSWATEAVASLNEVTYRHAMSVAQARYKLPPLTPKQVRDGYAKDRAMFLAALADVQLREGATEAAEHTLLEADRLQPLSSQISSLRGQVALREGNDGEALENFERAEATGQLKEPWRAEMLRLYTKSGTGGEAGLAQAIDAVYNRLYPAVFTLPPRTVPAGGHTALLELFTGSGCEPCVAPDLAVESLLTSYTRGDLVILEFDEHIPRPDPLANPDTVARGAMYRVGTTPEAFLDGQPVQVLGAGRADAENVVVGFADAVEDQAAQPTGVRLDLTAVRAADGAIKARAVVAPGATPDPGDAQKTRVSPHGPGTRATLHFALVEDHVRYSGENGIRFHRMVVRKTASATGPGLTLEPGTKTVREVGFDPDAISEELAAYLNGYEKSNDRFGEVRFLTTDIPLQPEHLAVAAWIENASTHEVLQAAYAPVDAGQ